MNEEAIRFGEDSRLSGIVCRPRNTTVPAKRPAVVFVSAGLLPKSGPYRMYTEFSRSIACMGFTTFRFDLSGNGDSLGATTAESADRTTVEDTRTALDELQREYGLNKFILFGLCSGAEASHKTALVDGRVVGIVALDGFIARNLRYYVWHYLPRLFSLRKWRDFLRNKTRRVLARDPEDEYPRDSGVKFWNDEYPSREQLAAAYRQLCERNVRQLLVFSGGAQNCSYERQFHDVFNDLPNPSLIDVCLFRKCDHTYVLREDRRELHRAVSQWFRAQYVIASTSISANPDVARQPRRRDHETAPVSHFNRTVDSAQRRREEI